MKKYRLCLFVAASLISPFVIGQDASFPLLQHAASAIAPKPRKEALNWEKLHKKYVAKARRGRIEVLFMGDSITYGWQIEARPIWDEYFAPLHAANFAIPGDRIENVLWRLQNGEFKGIKPKVVVLLIGTNNCGTDSAEKIAVGIKMIINEIHDKSPSTKVLLLGIFPRNKDSFQMVKIEKANAFLAKYDDGRMTRFININDEFFGPDGQVQEDIMFDYLHLTVEGYMIWANAMLKTLEDMLQ